MIKELREGLKDLISIELEEYGVNPDLIKISEENLLIVEDHDLDVSKFFEKTNFSQKKYKFKVYSLENGRLIFMPKEPFYEEYRNDEKISEELEEIREKANLLIKDFIFKFLEEILDKNLDIPLEKRFPKGLEQNFQRTDLFDVKNWKAMTVLANSKGSDDPDIGEFGPVGYVMIGINSGMIVPISRSDEHRMGYDLIYHYIDNNLIEQDQFYPIFSFGNNYVDGNDPVALYAFKVWRKLGGQNLVVNNSSRGYNSGEFKITMDDYIALNGQVEIIKGELLPIGKNLINHLTNLSTLIMEARKNPIKEKAVYKTALRTYLYYLKNVEVYFSEENLAEMTQKIENAQATSGEEGLKLLEQLFFGFDSFKNKLHIQLRKAISEERSLCRRDMDALFGDLELANHLLGSL